MHSNRELFSNGCLVSSGTAESEMETLELDMNELVYLMQLSKLGWEKTSFGNFNKKTTKTK